MEAPNGILDISFRGLSELPDWVLQLTHLRELIVNYNQITTIPSGISNLQKLERLVINNNQLARVPKEIGFLTQLQNLEMRNNKVHDIKYFYFCFIVNVGRYENSQRK